MKAYTAEEVERAAAWTELNVPGEHYLMLQELARRIRQDADDAKRDPATDPRPGDRVELADLGCVVFNDREAKAHELREWEEWRTKPGATVVRRQEVRQ